MVRARATRLGLGLCLLLATALACRADFDAGRAASKRGDHKAALLEFRKAAEAGDIRAAYSLGNLYLHGLGTDKDPSQAFKWIKQSADGGSGNAANLLARMYLRGTGTPRSTALALEQAMRTASRGNAEGQFLAFTATVSSPELSYQDAAGNVDNAKYTALAKRTNAERRAESEAYVMLHRSASQGYRAAIYSLIMAHALGVGSINRQHALAWYEKSGKETRLNEIKGRLDDLSSLGNTHASTKLVSESLDRAMTQALGLAQKEIKSCDITAAPPRLLKMKVTRDITDAEYLSIGVPQLSRLYLIKGNWDEEWLFETCALRQAVTITFSADGLGGAAVQAMKPAIPVR